jgi:hypothetical protein
VTRVQAPGGPAAGIRGASRSYFSVGGVFTMARRSSTSGGELYDLQVDPYELQSVHDDTAYAAVQAALADRLHALETCAGESCRTHQPEP